MWDGEWAAKSGGESERWGEQRGMESVASMEQHSPTLEFRSQFQLPFRFMPRRGKKSLCAKCKIHEVYSTWGILLSLAETLSSPPTHWKREARLKVKHYKHRILRPVSKLQTEGALAHFIHCYSWFSQENVEIHRSEVVGPRPQNLPAGRPGPGTKICWLQSTVFSTIPPWSIIIIIITIILVCTCGCVEAMWTGMVVKLSKNWSVLSPWSKVPRDEESLWELSAKVVFGELD